eukprot:CAMPEP_0117454458 /NCGR_PEP_ID=MMETSP0759-20121206/10807_1 /TAXON_ID=63605 /ORGANISM="Percolomonas cosmopolitus, Strain WS" /LENGTH=147 /DNA_ID=CAMNT_0005247637 /DNA_START=35 /DNA_END=478 /DNA_ORIENTATION=+
MSFGSGIDGRLGKDGNPGREPNIFPCPSAIAPIGPLMIFPIDLPSVAVACSCFLSILSKMLSREDWTSLNISPNMSFASGIDGRGMDGNPGRDIPPMMSFTIFPASGMIEIAGVMFFGPIFPIGLVNTGAVVPGIMLSGLKLIYTIT